MTIRCLYVLFGLFTLPLLLTAMDSEALSKMPADELIEFMKTPRERNNARGTAKATASQLPDEFWDTNAKDAAFALVNRHRSTQHRGDYTLNLQSEVPETITIPQHIVINLDNDGCYSRGSSHYQLSMTDEGCKLLYVASRTPGRNPGYYNLTLSETKYTFQRISLTRPEAEHMYRVIRFLSAMNFDRRQTAPRKPGSRTESIGFTMSTGDGRAQMKRFQTNEDDASIYAGRTWSLQGLAHDRLGRFFKAETTLNFALMVLRSVRERSNGEALMAPFVLSVLETHCSTDSYISEPVVGMAVLAAGDHAIASARPNIARIIAAGAPNLLNEAQVALLQIDASQDLDTLRHLALECDDGSRWAFCQIEANFPEAYCEMLAKRLEKETGRDARALFSAINYVDKPYAGNLAKTVIADAREDLFVRAVQVLQREGSFDKEAFAVDWLVNYASDPETEKALRIEALRCLIPHENPQHYSNPRIDAMMEVLYRPLASEPIDYTTRVYAQLLLRRNPEKYFAELMAKFRAADDSHYTSQLFDDLAETAYAHGGSMRAAYIAQLKQELKESQLPVNTIIALIQRYNFNELESALRDTITQNPGSDGAHYADLLLTTWKTPEPINRAKLWMVYAYKYVHFTRWGQQHENFRTFSSYFNPAYRRLNESEKASLNTFSKEVCSIMNNKTASDRLVGLHEHMNMLSGTSRYN